jgi:hypothetical protein
MRRRLTTHAAGRGGRPGPFARWEESGMAYRWYEGMRGADDVARVVVWQGDQPVPLLARLDLRSHSPTGFEWGYGGSGPAQLALAILADATGDDELSLQLYQKFKRDVVARLGRGSWFMHSQYVRDWSELAERHANLLGADQDEGSVGDGR